MSRYDEMKGSMQALYDEAQKELQELEKKRQDILSTLEYLGPICGKKTYSVDSLKSAKPGARVSRKPAAKVSAPAKSDNKKARIKESVIRALVLGCLSEAHPNSMSASEIFEKLNKAGMPNTTSFRTRIYGKLGVWTSEGLLRRLDRGVYQVVSPIKK